MDDYYDLGTYSAQVSCSGSEANLWFNRGLNWTFGFNHEEAIRCFERVIEADPGCAMAHWGKAYAAGPNYNIPWSIFDDAGRARALATGFRSAGAAQALAGTAQDWEAALIGALSARYPQETPIDGMEAWDRAFADAMRQVFLSFPDNLDVRSVFAEALMNISPWKLWDLKTGRPADGAHTLEVRTLLEDAFRNDERALAHPGLLHLYVHLMEMSPWPEKALRAGDALRTLVPDAGHLIHMPTHIDVLCGNYHDVVHWNEVAIEADLKFYAREGARNRYSGYRQHNYHFVIYGAMFLGQLEPALRAVRGMSRTLPEEFLRIESPPMADYFESYLGMEPHVLVRFGKWHDILKMTLPDDPVLYCTLAANIHYAQTVALAALGRVDEALQAEEGFHAAILRVPETRLLHNNKVVDLLEIARRMARGEILYRQGDHEAAFAMLRSAVALEEGLAYDEPWGWMQPVRHALGALLFEQGRIDEAEGVFREDLGIAGALSRASIHPDNVWSLKGLHDCLTARGGSDDLAWVRRRLDIAQARADREVAASCFCAQAAMGQ